MADNAWLSQIFQSYQEGGKMKASHLGDAMRSAGMNPTNAEVSQIVQRAESSEVTLEGFSRLMQEALAEWSSRDQAHELLSSFQVFDAEATGFLSQQKILEIMRMGGNPFPDAKMQEMLKGIPLNSDGSVEYRWLIPYLLGPSRVGPVATPVKLPPAARFRRAVRKLKMLRMVAFSSRKFSAENAVGVVEANLAIDEEFEQVMHRMTRGKTTVIRD
mmetsp:Transcript_80665/g.127444  ORF Transcript_80665/g.127444 Transcript_80665/m.127444 type:complete len:216 (-) Transcript_80665:58-705(-)